MLSVKYIISTTTTTISTIYNINSKKVMEKLQNANNYNNEEVLDGLYNA